MTFLFIIVLPIKILPSVINSHMYSNKEAKGLRIDSDPFIHQLFLCLRNWKIFSISLIFAVFIAAIYFRYAEKIFYSQAIFILQDEKRASGDMAGLSELASLAGRTSSSAAYVNDQTQILKSRRLMRKVVVSNDLNIGYYIMGKVRDKEIIERFAPLRLKLVDVKPLQDSVVYTIYAKKQGKKLKVWDNSQLPKEIDIGKGFNSLVGNLKLEIGHEFPQWEGEMRFEILPVDLAVDILKNQVQIESNPQEQSFAIKLSAETSSPEKGELIINSLIKHYDQDRNNDREEISKNTSRFINSRLELISQDLKSADSMLTSFKEDANLLDIQAQNKLQLNVNSEHESQVLELETQLYISKIIQESITLDDSTLLPFNIGLNDFSIQEQIKSYNELVLEKFDLLKSAKENNPIHKALQNKQVQFRRSLIHSLKNYQIGLEVRISKIHANITSGKQKLSSILSHEQEFWKFSRQQKVVENLYLFLLQKREENQINASARPSNIKVVDFAYGYSQPISPKIIYVLLTALVLGLLVPYGFLYLKFLLDHKIHSKEDVEELIGAPILGQIPKVKEKFVGDNSRTSLAEGLRIIRTNLAYVLPKNAVGKVIYVTSTISGEGKSFIVTNLAQIIAQSGKSVLLVGADIRSPKILEYLGLSHFKNNVPGITQYLVNPSISVEKLIINKPKPYEFDIISSGYIAPNPADLLVNGNFKGIVDYGRGNYDYVLVDTAPVSLVTDTLLINDFADLNMYVVRAGFLDKRMAEICRELHQNGKLRNIAIVLNNVDFQAGYGYGYRGQEDDKKNFWKKVLNYLKKAINGLIKKCWKTL